MSLKMMYIYVYTVYLMAVCANVLFLKEGTCTVVFNYEKFILTSIFN